VCGAARGTNGTDHLIERVLVDLDADDRPMPRPAAVISAILPVNLMSDPPCAERP